MKIFYKIILLCCLVTGSIFSQSLTTSAPTKLNITHYYTDELSLQIKVLNSEGDGFNFSGYTGHIIIKSDESASSYLKNFAVSFTDSFIVVTIPADSLTSLGAPRTLAYQLILNNGTKDKAWLAGTFYYSVRPVLSQINSITLKLNTETLQVTAMGISSGTSIDTTSLSNRIDLKQDIISGNESPFSAWDKNSSDDLVKSDTTNKVATKTDLAAKQDLITGNESVFTGWDKTSSDDLVKNDTLTSIVTFTRMIDSLNKIRDSLAATYNKTQVNSLLATKYNKSDSTTVVTIYRLIDSLAALRNSLVLKDSNSYAVPFSYGLLGLKLGRYYAGNGTNSLPAYSFASKINSGFNMLANGSLQYVSNSVQRFTVDSLGNMFLQYTGGSMSIGDTISINKGSRLYVRNGSAGTVTPVGGTIATFENNTTSYLSMLSTDATTSGIVMGSPGDSFGAYMSWGFNNNRLDIGTANSGDAISFLTGNAVAAVRILSNANVGINNINPLYRIQADFSGTGSDTAKTAFLFTDISRNVHSPSAAAAKDTSAIYGLFSATGNPVFGVVNKDGVTIFKADSANIYFPALDSLKRKSANTLYVGLNMRYPTISAAITSASNYNVIEITNGTYTENLTINKDITIVGTGSVIIKGKVTVTDTAVIKNVTLINNTLSTDTVISVRSFCKLDNVNVRGLLNSISGKIEHLRGVQYGGANLTGSSVYNADLDSMSTGGYSNNDFNLRNSTVANIISQYSSLGFTAWNTSSLNYSSKKQTSGIATRDSAVITVNNTYSDYSCKYTTAGGTIKLYNVTSYFSYPDTVTGWHNIEMSAGYPNNRIEAYNSYFEFTGYQGNVFTTGGSPFEGLGGKFIAHNSTFINDNGGKYPPGYNLVCKLATNTDAEITDCYMRYKQDKYSGYDGLGITFGKNDTTNMRIKIVNTIIETDSSSPFSYGFSASQMSGGALVVPYASILGANDFCFIDNVKWITKQNNETRFFTTILGSYNLDSLKLVLSNHGYYPQELFALHASRTWIPVVSGNTNTDAITISDCLYSLDGNLVTFSGEIEVDPTAASLVQIQLSLPVYSNFSVGRDADGVITSYTGVGYGYISANSSTDKLHIYITPSTTSNTGFKFTGQYFIR